MVSTSLLLLSCGYTPDTALLKTTSGSLGFCWPLSQIYFPLILVAYCCKVKALSDEQFNDSIERSPGKEIKARLLHVEVGGLGKKKKTPTQHPNSAFL